MKEFKRKLLKALVAFQKYINCWWYGPSIAALSFIDNLVLIIPNDGILISASMLSPKKWFGFAIFISIGSTLGAMTLAYLVSIYGMDVLHIFSPNIESSSSWLKTAEFFNDYGLIVVFIVAATPLFQQPSVVLATLAATPLWQLGVCVFAGRALKFILMSWIASHAPKLLSKLWGLESEMKEMGLNLEPSDTRKS